MHPDLHTDLDNLDTVEHNLRNSAKGSLDTYDVTVSLTDDEAKVLAHQIVGHKDTLEDYEGQLSNSDDHIAVVKVSIFGLDPAWQRPLRSDRQGVAGTNVARVESCTSKLEKNHEGFNGVASLIDSLVAVLAKGSQEAKVGNAHSQGDYEEFTKESAQSRAEKVKEVEELQNTKASLSSSLTQSKEELAGAVSSAAEMAKMIRSLHQSCDWLLQNLTFGRQPVLERLRH